MCDSTDEAEEGSALRGDFCHPRGAFPVLIYVGSQDPNGGPSPYPLAGHVEGDLAANCFGFSVGPVENHDVLGLLGRGGHAQSEESPV